MKKKKKKKRDRVGNDDALRHRRVPILDEERHVNLLQGSAFRVQDLRLGCTTFTEISS
jgi:hypothetical protein